MALVSFGGCLGGAEALGQIQPHPGMSSLGLAMTLMIGGTVGMGLLTIVLLLLARAVFRRL